jgi:hypothetical protein
MATKSPKTDRYDLCKLIRMIARKTELKTYIGCKRNVSVGF